MFFFVREYGGNPEYFLQPRPPQFHFILLNFISLQAQIIYLSVMYLLRSVFTSFVGSVAELKLRSRVRWYRVTLGEIFIRIFMILEIF